MAFKQKQSQKQKRTRKQQRAQGPKRKGTSTVRPRPARKTLAGPRRPRRRQPNLNPGIAGVGMMTGGVIVNKRTRAPPRIEEGEELITAVVGSTGFATTQFNLNPANKTTFPVLQQIASLFERYEFETLSFHFGHDVSGFATQGQTGLVYLSALYDAASSAPSTINQIEATDPFVPCMPNENSCLRLDKRSMHPSNEPKYCLSAVAPPGGTDIKTYNAGSMFVSTSGLANTSECGKLRVKYRVKLYDRILDSSSVAPPANYQATVFASTVTESPTSGVQFQFALATTIVNGLGVVNTAGSMVLPAGNYIIDANISMTAATNITTCAVGLLKNAAAVGTTNYLIVAAAAVMTTTSLAIDPAFVTSNGTDAFTLVFTSSNTFTGAGTASATLRIIAA